MPSKRSNKQSQKLEALYDKIARFAKQKNADPELLAILNWHLGIKSSQNEQHDMFDPQELEKIEIPVLGQNNFH